MNFRFSGVWNIIRFNWHFYLIALIVTLFLTLMATRLSSPLNVLFWFIFVLSTLTTSVSLLASWYVYDLSDLYSFGWLDSQIDKSAKNVINIHAGFDETSGRLRRMFPQASLKVMDFYDATKHTEISIRRARKACPPSPETVSVETNKLHLPDDSVNYVFCILAAHEIRNDQERIQFFSELKRSIDSKGKIIVVEHVRNWRNFLAYNIGFLHFLSQNKWLITFRSADLKVAETISVNPFITAFALEKNGIVS